MPTTTTTAAASATLALKSAAATTDTDEDLEIYDEIEIEDMTFDSALQIFHYPCPCGDRFEICIDDLREGEDIAVCPNCSLMIRVIFDVDELPEKKEDQNAS